MDRRKAVVKVVSAYLSRTTTKLEDIAAVFSATDQALCRIPSDWEDISPSPARDEPVEMAPVAAAAPLAAAVLIDEDVSEGPPVVAPGPVQKPAVPIKESVTDRYIICLEDGKKLQMLKRYLSAQYQMSPDEYRAKWGLPPEYPMVAPAYKQKRSALAKDMGFGRTGRGGGKGT